MTDCRYVRDCLSYILSALRYFKHIYNIIITGTSIHFSKNTNQCRCVLLRYVEYILETYVILSLLLRSKLGYGILLRSLFVVLSYRSPWWKNRILENQDGISNGARSEGGGTVQYSMYRTCDTDIVVLPSCVVCKQHLHDAKGRRPNHCDELIPCTLDERIQWTVDISRC